MTDKFQISEIMDSVDAILHRAKTEIETYETELVKKIKQLNSGISENNDKGNKKLLIAALGVNTPVNAESCKAWALDKGYVIYSAIRPGSRVHGTAVVQKTCGGDHLFYGSGETELEAIIDSCEWILKQQEGVK